MRRAFILVPALLSGAALAAVAGWRACTPSAGSDVAVTEVRRGTFARTVSAEGNLEAVEATPLGPPPDVGRPLKIAWLAPDGTPVKAGDVVVRFDPTEMEQELQDGRNERATVDSRIEQKTVREESNARNLDRDAALAALELEHARQFQSKDPLIFSRFEIIEADIDQELAGRRTEHAARTLDTRREVTRSELDLLAIERRKAEIKVQHAEAGLTGLEVRAPHDGIFVLDQSWGGPPEVGEVVWGGNTVAELPRLDAMQVRVHVLEADAGGLREGLPATFALEAHPEVTWRGTVTKVDRLAKRRSWRTPIQYFGVLIRPEETAGRAMKPGQRVMATLTLEQRADVLTLPRQSVFEREGQTVAYRRTANGFEAVALRLGPAALGRVVVEEGLAEGDAIALWDPTGPRPGSPGASADEAAPQLGSPSG